jgi:hypothetical protein
VPENCLILTISRLISRVKPHVGRGQTLLSVSISSPSEVGCGDIGLSLPAGNGSPVQGSACISWQSPRLTQFGAANRHSARQTRTLTSKLRPCLPSSICLKYNGITSSSSSSASPCVILPLDSTSHSVRKPPSVFIFIIVDCQTVSCLIGLSSRLVRYPGLEDKLAVFIINQIWPFPCRSPHSETHGLTALLT